MKKISFCLICIFTGLYIIQCGSTPEEPVSEAEQPLKPSPEPTALTEKLTISRISTSIEVLSNVISPNSDGIKDKIAFRITPDIVEKLTKWKIGYKHIQSGIIYKETSGESAPPESIGWDGFDDKEVANEGSYVAVLTAEYTGLTKPFVTESAPFMLDTTPPVLTYSMNPQPFSPDGDRVEDQVTLSFTAEDASEIYKWQIDIYDEEGELFHRLSGLGFPKEEIIWDGISASGYIVEMASFYKTVLTVTDIGGNTSNLEKTLSVDVLLRKTKDGRFKIKTADIIFEPYMLDFTKIGPKIIKSNKYSLSLLKRLLSRYKQYKIQIEGHAVMPQSKLANKKTFDKENKKVLIPLSKGRAEAVKKALIEFGIDGDRIVTKGLGAEYPLVPHDDLKNRWMNRRVEFYLLKE